MDASVSVKAAETAELDEHEYGRALAPRLPHRAAEAGVNLL
jgi:hypothetical protein